MITKLNLDGDGNPPDIPEGDSDAVVRAPVLYASIAGQILVGRYLLHIGGSCGAVVEETSDSASAHVHPRPTPILPGPGSTRGLLDRQEELTSALSAVDSGLSIEVSGQPGIGKTAFLHQLASHSGAAAFVDGVAYIAARHQSSTDILQDIFEAFYESDQVCKPTLAEIHRGLEEKQALLLIDDVHLTRDEMEQVLDVAPRSALAIATRERCLFGELRSVALEGLPTRESAVLLEREVGRSLSVAERSAAASLCGAIGGHPLRIRQAAAIIRERGISIEVLARDAAPESLVCELLTSIDNKQRHALLALATAPGVPLQLQHVSGLAEVTDIEPSLALLVRRGLVVRSRSRYRLADGVADQLRRTDDLKPWVNRSITYFTAWAERYRRTPNTLLDESAALLRAQYEALDSQRWGEALRLGRLLEAALVLGARWGAWAIVLDRCLTAAKAMKDQSAEAWVLHETGTRALCLGESGTARSLLGQAVRLRETMDDSDAIAASRRNLSFVLAPVAIVSRRRETERFGEVGDLDALPLRETFQPVTGVPHARVTGPIGIGATVLVMMLFAVLGGVAFWMAPHEFLWKTWDAAGGPPVLQGSLGAATTDTEITPHPVRVSPEPRVLRFTAFPDVIARGESVGLCYEISSGTRIRIDPDVGDVGAQQRNCVRAAPTEATTYVLTAQGENGQSVKQNVFVRVGSAGSAPPGIDYRHGTTTGISRTIAPRPFVRSPIRLRSRMTSPGRATSSRCGTPRGECCAVRATSRSDRRSRCG